MACWTPRIIEGATWQGEIAIENPDGSAFDLTGYSPVLRIKDQRAGTIIELVDGDGLTVNSVAGLVEYFLSAVVTAGMSVSGRWAYEFDLRTGVENQRYMSGPVIFSGDLSD